MTFSPDPRLAIAIDAVASACHSTDRIQRSRATPGQLSKNDRSPVTIADFTAQAIVIKQLQADLASQLPVVGEESASMLVDPTQQTLRDAILDCVSAVYPGISIAEIMNLLDVGNHDASADQYWTLDPVDGTKGFLRDGHYAISLGLIEHGRVTQGVLGCPRLPMDIDTDLHSQDASGVLFVATQGQGCWCRALDTDGPFQPVSYRPSADGSLRFCESVETAHSDHDWSDRLTARLGRPRVAVRLDSQCKYGVVARGQADAYLRLPTQQGYQEKIWDHAAGMLIAQEAGLIVTDIHGRPLDFSRGMTLSANQGVICAAPELHSQIIQAIADL